MKCLTCNECLNKETCAKANGYKKAPFPLLDFKIKVCELPENSVVKKSLTTGSQLNEL